MLPCFAPSSCLAWVKKSIIPNRSTAGPVQHTGSAKLILTAWILQATTPNQWQAAEQKAWESGQEGHLFSQQLTTHYCQLYNYNLASYLLS